MLSVAYSRALLPAAVGASGSAPAARSGIAHARFPERAATHSGVKPPLPAAECGAPYFRRSSSVAASEWSTAAWTHEFCSPISFEPSEASAPF